MLSLVYPLLTSRIADSQNHSIARAYLFYSQITVKTISTLLQVFCTDLEKTGREDDPPRPDGRHTPLSRLTVLASKVLPTLRLCGAWLLANPHIVAASIVGDALRTETDGLWAVFTRTLNLMASAFTMTQLPELSYQLQEDVESTGFMPLICERTDELSSVKATSLNQPRYSDRDTKRLKPDMEMLGRIREFMIDGLVLAHDPVCFPFHTG